MLFTRDLDVWVFNIFQYIPIYILLWLYLTIHHPRRLRGSQLGLENRCDESFQARAEEPLGTDSHRTISKRSRECWLLIRHKKCFVLLRPIGEQFLLSYFREFVHDRYYLATVARFVHQAFLTRQRNYRWAEKRFGCYQQEQFNLHWENYFSDGSQCIVLK